MVMGRAGSGVRDPPRHEPAALPTLAPATARTYRSFHKVCGPALALHSATGQPPSRVRAGLALRLSLLEDSRARGGAAQLDRPSMFLPPIFRTFWQAYLSSTPEPARAEERFYEACRFGHTVENANKTADLIVSGEKTATSSLLAEFEISGKPLPEPGSLSIVVNGVDQAVAVIQTREVEILRFDEIGPQFAHDYGEGDRTLAFWQTAMWAYYFEESERLGVHATQDMPMVCEYFEVVFRAQPAAH